MRLAVITLAALLAAAVIWMLPANPEQSFGANSRLSSGSALADNIAFGTHQAGDVIVVWAYRNNSSTIPSVPAGWTTITTVGASVHSGVLAYKVAASGSEISGTWTNATAISYSVYRGVDIVTPFSHPAGQSGTGTSVSYSGIAPSIDNPGNDWVITVYGATSNAGNAQANPANNMTFVTGDRTTAGQEIAIFDSNAGVASYGFNSKTHAASITWVTKTVALRYSAAAPPAAAPPDDGVVWFE